ncbi:hypothetical protein TNCV_2995091 [Trichonephila clavipes]|nr:hypothetical protein TNCV_2995091 [Trichonephila clavipes]
MASSLVQRRSASNWQAPKTHRGLLGMHSTLEQWLGNSGRHHVAILESAGPPDDTANIPKKQNNKRTGIRYLKMCFMTPCGRGSLAVKVSDHGWHVTSSSPVPLKTHCVGQRCTLDLSRAQARLPVGVV